MCALRRGSYDLGEEVLQISNLDLPCSPVRKQNSNNLYQQRHLRRGSSRQRAARLVAVFVLVAWWLVVDRCLVGAWCLVLGGCLVVGGSSVSASSSLVAATNCCCVAVQTRAASVSGFVRHPSWTERTFYTEQGLTRSSSANAVSGLGHSGGSASLGRQQLSPNMCVTPDAFAPVVKQTLPTYDTFLAPVEQESWH